MIQKFSALAAAIAFAVTSLAPVSDAYAQRRHHDGYGRDYHRGYDHDRRRWRDHDDDDGDAVAAGVVGLVLGLALGSMASQSGPRDNCYDNYRRCAAPPPPCRNPCGYGRDSYYDPRYDDRRYEDGQSAYERDYGYEGNYDPRLDDRDRQCVRRERQWDRYANRYVTVDVPC